jgi:MscS family membrane protein
VEVDSASPRAAVLGYLAAERNNDHARAAGWLDRSDGALAARAPDLARRLSDVLDSHLWMDPERISPLAIGDTADGLPRDRETIGEVPGPGGRKYPIRLSRVLSDSGARWVFSGATVAEIDELYQALPDHWVREHLPEVLLGNGPFDVRWWQWLALLTLVPLAAMIGLVLSGPTQSVLRRIVSNTKTDVDDLLVAAARGPLVLLLGVLSSRVLLQWIALPGPSEAFVVELQRAIAVVAVFWILLRVIGVLQSALPLSEWGGHHPALRSLIPLGGRIARLLVFVLGVLTVIATFGYPVATILAGLGIGGIAVALGAQKSLEHFFGSISIGVDQPFRVGDWVIVDGVEGEVESIGLRSTRIRTMDRTVVSIPNGRLSESQSENFGHRDRYRLRTTIGLEYGTSAATMRQVRDGIEAALRAHPATWPDRVVVRFFQFGPSSLDIDAFCWILADSMDGFRKVREELYLEIMRVVEGAGASFAFPTQTLWLKRAEDDGTK